MEPKYSSNNVDHLFLVSIIHVSWSLLCLVSTTCQLHINSVPPDIITLSSALIPIPKSAIFWEKLYVWTKSRWVTQGFRCFIRSTFAKNILKIGKQWFFWKLVVKYVL